MDQVLTHLSDIERKLGKIDKISSKGASQLNMKDMVKLSQKGSSVTACMKTTIKELDVPMGTAIKPTSTEASAMLITLTHIAELNIHGMEITRNDKPAVDRMRAAGMVRKNLVKGQVTSKQFWRLVAEKMPAGEMQEETRKLEKRVDKAQQETLKVYAGATGGEEQDVEGEDDSD